tara:strand:+ start:251 stop:1018 length:768 start_codon:yes stop_codon:yes gene_type:complete
MIAPTLAKPPQSPQTDTEAGAMGERILIIEDEAAIADALLYALGSEGFEVHWCALAHDGLQWLQQQPVDFVVLDVGLPDISGFELCRQIRQFSSVPVMFLTARKEEVDRIVGLEIGADDYVVKPFSPREISARVRAILRRARPSPDIPQASASSSAFLHDPQRRRIRYRDHWLDLTRYEYLILSTLLKHPEHVMSRSQLMDSAWEDPAASFDRAVDTHIKGIRAKLKKITPNTDPIITHRGLGYSIDLQDGSSSR